MSNFFGRIFKLKEWADWRRNRANSEFIKKTAYDFFNVDQFKANKAKSFDVMAKRYHLNDEQLGTQAKGLLVISSIFLVCTFLLWGYLFFHIHNENYAISVVVLCFSFIPLVLAFRYHFYYMLIKNKRLNLTIKDWLKLCLNKD